MAITRMQQPRQMYGLGSFVKKAVRKVTKPFTKVAKKIVPKEIAGIMRLAAPFLGPFAGPAAYLLGTAKQTGRISPVDLALTLAPYAKFKGGTGIGQFKPTGYGDMGSGQSLRNIFLRGEDSLGEVNKYMLRENNAGVPVVVYKDRPNLISPMSVDKYQEAISGANPIFGKLGTKADEFLFGAPKVPGTELINPAATAAAGKNVPMIPEVKAKSGIFGKGGEMFKFGKDGVGILDTKAGQTLFGKKTDKGFEFSPLKLGSIGVSALSLIQNAKTPDEAGTALAAATGNSDDYDKGYALFSQLTPELFAIPEKFRMNVQDGGIMRTNYSIGSEDPKPVNPFAPKPTGPVLPEEDKPFRPKPLKPIKMSEDNEENMMMAGSDRYQKILEEIINEMEGILGRELTDAEYDLAGQLAFDKFNSPKDLAVGGRVDYALGTKPTAEESGLGGLPIEADMRYTGGFMPYGAKEKADDVPARLSKNEFVFTADAVRAAGGGSVNEGAKKMYQTMKKLEAKPEAKGMTA